MPELPEVESIKNGLNHIVKDKKVIGVDVYWPRIIDGGHDIDAFKDRLIGQSIREVRRRGKFLLFILDEDVLISHLRMEGKYFFESQSQPANHTHVVFSFSDGNSLHYNDVRKFGRMSLVSKDRLFHHKSLNSLGPEPFADQLTEGHLEKFLKNRTKVIKTILLDQHMVVGVGNIYADEILFDSFIHPKRPGKSLGKNDIKRLYESIIKIIGQAVKAGGSTIRTYHNAFGEDGTYQNYHQVYGKKGQLCPRCQKVRIEKIQLNGRGTHYCPRCQR